MEKVPPPGIAKPYRRRRAAAGRILAVDRQDCRLFGRNHQQRRSSTFRFGSSASWQAGKLGLVPARI
jgi:hypothetical protein